MNTPTNGGIDRRAFVARLLQATPETLVGAI